MKHFLAERAVHLLDGAKCRLFTLDEKDYRWIKRINHDDKKEEDLAEPQSNSWSELPIR